MRDLASRNESIEQSGTATAIAPSGRIFLTLSVSALGIAMLYFGALYLIAR